MPGQRVTIHQTPDPYAVGPVEITVIPSSNDGGAIPNIAINTSRNGVVARRWVDPSLRNDEIVIRFDAPPLTDPAREPVAETPTNLTTPVEG